MHTAAETPGHVGRAGDGSSRTRRACRDRRSPFRHGNSRRASPGGVRRCGARDRSRTAHDRPARSSLRRHDTTHTPPVALAADADRRCDSPYTWHDRRAPPGLAWCGTSRRSVAAWWARGRPLGGTVYRPRARSRRRSGFRSCGTSCTAPARAWACRRAAYGNRGSGPSRGAACRDRSCIRPRCDPTRAHAADDNRHTPRRHRRPPPQDGSRAERDS